MELEIIDIVKLHESLAVITIAIIAWVTTGASWEA